MSDVNWEVEARAWMDDNGVPETAESVRAVAELLADCASLRESAERSRHHLKAAVTAELLERVVAALNAAGLGARVLMSTSATPPRPVGIDVEDMPGDRRLRLMVESLFWRGVL